MEDSEPMVSEDFDERVDIIPVSDPNAGTMAQRIMQYQAALQLSAQSPEMYDLPLLHRQMLDVLGIQDADQIVPTENDMKPKDPVSENMDILNGKPVKAFIYQDHEAHIQAHMAFLQDPKLAELVGQSPNAKKMQAVMAAHIQEHLAFLYRQNIEKELGMELPTPEEDLPEDIEYRISRLVAPAAAQLTGKSAQEKQAQQAQQQMQDPVIQMQMQELQLKQAEIQQKAEAEMARIQLETQKALAKSQLDQQRLEQQARLETAKLGAKIAETNTKEELESAKIASQEQLASTKLGIEIAKETLGD
tara:strand:+ start:115 stop:1026 length:912 start_codon:yes stop_codon:yes gene_type:complete